MRVWRRRRRSLTNNKIASATRTETTTPIALPALKKEVVLLGEASINDVKDERNGIYLLASHSWVRQFSPIWGRTLPNQGIFSQICKGHP